MPDTLDVAGSLRGERIFLTGATGFLGKVLVEKLLWSVPDVGRLLLLVRPSGDRDADERLADEVLGSPIMAQLRTLHGEGWQAWAESKVEAVPGDLGKDRFGLEPDAWADLCRRVDRVVAGAATVTFDERLDRALELNARGALRTLALAREAGDVPLVHVSTCFVSGRRTGRVPEEPEPDQNALDVDAVLADLDEVCGTLEAAGESGDAPWVAAGASAAARHGFHDVYTLTKALGERLLARERGAVPAAVVRPAIVESAVAEPIPGWIETVRVADPLLAAYGRGRVHQFPGDAAAPMELIPVDYVVHALLAALADLRRETPGNAVRVYQIGSSRNPITLGELMAHGREGFLRRTPLQDEDGQPVAVPEASFVDPEELRRRLGDRLAKARSVVERRTLEHFLRLIEVYRPYLSRGASYDDTATRGLWDRLSPAGKETFPFDVAAIDWRDYVSRIHVPGLVRFALKAESGAPPPAAREEPRGSGTPSPGGQGAGGKTLFHLFAGVAEAHPEVMALQTFRDGRWLRYTYGQALTATSNLAWILATRYDVGRGDRVVLWASGSPEWVIATFAVHRLGAAVVPLDPQWPADEIAAATRLVKAKLLCAAPRLLAGISSTGAGCPVAALAAPLVPEPDVPLLPGADTFAASEPAGTPEDTASILFTSGTTVAPKAVPLTHANYLANVRDLVPLMRLSRERLLSVLPIHHVFEQMVGLLVPLAGASTVSYVAEIKPAEIRWMMNVTRPTVLVAVPRLLELLHGGIFQSVRAGGPMLGLLFKVLFALSRLTGGRFGHRLFAKVHRRFGGSLRRIATGGSALEPSLGRSFQWMGFQVAEGYGMTETSPVMTVNPWDAIRFGSVGRPLPGVEIELRPPAEASGLSGDPGAPPARREGEIWVRGDNVMAGYFENPEATAEVLRDGWLDTGDLGWLDADGYLHVSGRTKDVIVTDAGKNVYPEEVELRYRDVPGVEELIVLGLPGPRGRGEQVAAVVVPRPGATDADVEQIRAAVAERSAGVPSYQQATRVVAWRGALPKTTTLKVQRGLLRDAVLAGERGDGAGPAPSPAAAAGEPLSEEESWVIDTVARLTRTRPDQVGAGDRLADLGVDSLTRVELVAAVETRLDRRLDDSAIVSLRRVRDVFELVEGV
jgi:long-chain acyl-CoA synthetase